MHALTDDTVELARTNVLTARVGGWLHTHPVLRFVLTAYALSWPMWGRLGALESSTRTADG